ncbi:folic acid synthesis protein [Magnaporthiopsis poae ATCC 64411]|uniref:2-amino-4-hydroxy-6-hydroxymethyldihydropteridine diphosphokinase n=1 Tax=Magnaporthiopsis poae (strain ATCC 64411 / 73-15) TaxID=644358 RepID=A0A0C4DYR5_MAGP6|nr:folic acid synthesis protein [Magnaporthiopsis poae ATCC 64411]
MSLVSLAPVRSGRCLFLAKTRCSACQTGRLAVRSAGHSQSVFSRVKAASTASPSSRRLFTCSALVRTRGAGQYTRHTLPASAAPSLSTAINGGDKATGEQPASGRSGGCCGGAGRKRRRMAYVALGSNMGDRVAMIEQACREMDRRGVRVRRTSSLWETQPMYVLDQDMFVNGVCEVGSCCLILPTYVYMDF